MNQIVSNHSPRFQPPHFAAPTPGQLAAIEIASDLQLLRTDSRGPLVDSRGNHFAVRAVPPNDQEIAYSVGNSRYYIRPNSQKAAPCAEFGNVAKKLAELQQRGFLPCRIKAEDRYLERHKAPAAERVADSKHYMTYFCATRLGSGTEPAVLARGRGPAGRPLAEPVNELTILTGPCLFGVYGAVAEFDDGRHESIVNPLHPLGSGRITGVRIADNLSLYEIEFVHRMTSMIRSITSETNTVTRIAIHVPREEYVAYLIPKLLSGEVSEAVFEAYAAAVLERSLRIKQFLANRLRGCGAIEFLQPLAPVAEMLLRPRASSEAELLVAMLKQMVAADPLFANLAQKHPITRLQDLNNASYVSGYISAGACTDNDRRGALVVQNHPEERTYNIVAEELGKKFPVPFRLAAVHAFERVFVSDSDSEHDGPVSCKHLYFTDLFVGKDQLPCFENLLSPKFE